MDIQQQQFIKRAAQQAEQAGHIFPVMAACEAALESGYGTSALAIADKNVFGMKAHVAAFNEVLKYVSMPTKEFINHHWVSISALWCVYPDQAACFTDRMETLKRLAPHYPHYAAALAATNPIDYVTAVSQSWSTDPHRAETCITIYSEYLKESI